MSAVQATQQNAVKNRLRQEDEAVHGWYRFVLGYPPHLVRQYLDTFGADPDHDVVFDPFCGTATTPVEARLRGFRTVSADAHPVAVLAARTKLNWEVDTGAGASALDEALGLAIDCLARHDVAAIPDDEGLQLTIPDLLPTRRAGVSSASGAAETFTPSFYVGPENEKLIPSGFISPKPLLRVLAMRHAIECAQPDTGLRNLLLLALANCIVSTAGNIAFGPEIGKTPPKSDADVLGDFASTVKRMLVDLETLNDLHPGPYPAADVSQDDARLLWSVQPDARIGAVITSPPYPNEKDYTRSTRLETVLLGYLRTRRDLRSLKASLLRSNTRNVFVRDNDDAFVADLPAISRVADAIEQRRVQMGKTSGFERQYHRVVRLYFGGMYRHFASLRSRLRPGARCAYVVGDQASFLRVPIRTAHLLADVALKAGYRVDGIELWRTRRATATGDSLDENVLLLTSP